MIMNQSGEALKDTATPEMFAATMGAQAESGNSCEQIIDNLAPERFGRFVLLRLLGAGGMGQVYAAYDEKLDRKVALKLLHNTGHAGAEQKARILREAQAMARLAHPNVVPIYEVDETAGRLFIAMEFVEGGTLTQWQQATSRTWEEIMQMYLTAGAGLLAAHQAGLVHRDFKPDNVLVGQDGRPRVADFGLARVQSASEAPRSSGAPASAEQARGTANAAQAAIGSPPLLDRPLTVTGALVGTPAYMSPEQHCGLPADARSDQFSFCAALYEALFRTRPFDGNSLAELSANVIAGRLKRPPAQAGIPPQVVTALLRGLAVEPAQRFDSMGELLDALFIDTRHHPAGAGKARRIFIALMVAGIIIPTIVTNWMMIRGHLMLHHLVLQQIPLFSGAVGLAWVLRNSLLRNSFHRGMVKTLLILIAALGVFRALALVMGRTLSEAMAFELLVLGTTVAFQGALFLPGGWPIVGFCIAMAFGMVGYPSQLLPLTPLAISVVGMGMSWLWNRQASALANRSGASTLVPR